MFDAETGRMTGAVNMLIDISEQQRARARIAESEARFRRIFDDASVALEKGNSKAGFAAYRAFAHLYEGNPRGAIDEPFHHEHGRRPPHATGSL